MREHRVHNVATLGMLFISPDLFSTENSHTMSEREQRSYGDQNLPQKCRCCNTVVEPSHLLYFRRNIQGHDMFPRARGPVTGPTYTAVPPT